MENTSIWSQIPLEDYEQHMAHKDVGQAQLLNVLTEKYLQRHRPKDILFIGVSGGNGLEHIDPSYVNSVVGIDINPTYIEASINRFATKIPQLKLVSSDLTEDPHTHLRAEFIWAALIFEYIDVEKAFAFINRNAAQSAILIITLQVDNGIKSVSQTGISSIQAVGQIFTYVDEGELKKIAARSGFELVASEENMFQNGKSFITHEFIR